MPAVLECASLDKLTTPPPPDDNNPEPLHITFSCGYVPTGTFCGLIAQLVSRGPHGILGLTWDLVEHGVKRNFVQFHVDYANKVTLMCHDRCYELRVERNNSDITLHDRCTNVLSVILYNLNNLYKNLITQIAFRCPCTKHSACRGVDNLCTLISSKTSTKFYCERCPVTLNAAQKVWIGKNVASGSGAKLEVVKYAEDDFSFNWTKEGSRRQIETASILTFQSVSEEDFSYYCCEVKKAERVVLTVYRALYRDESQTSCADSS